VQNFAAWVVEKILRNISNDAAVTWNIANNKIAAGYYFARFSSDDAWSLGNTRWMEVGGSGDLVNLNNGVLSAFAIAEARHRGRQRALSRRLVECDGSTAR
jgi:hypothetical protein